LAQLLTKAIKGAKAKHGPSRRVRLLLTLDTPLTGLPAASVGEERRRKSCDSATRSGVTCYTFV